MRTGGTCRDEQGGRPLPRPGRRRRVPRLRPGCAPLRLAAARFMMRAKNGAARTKDSPMIELREIAPGLLVAGQVRPEDMPALAEAGIRGVICNRPDGEEPGQPDYAAVAEAARAQGLDIRFVPMSHHAPDPALPEKFTEAAAELPRPLLAYCRSGARSQSLMNLLPEMQG